MEDDLLGANTPPPKMIETAGALRDAVNAWRKAGAVALDTEFVRTRTFYAHVGLVQISAGREVTLVDVVALGDVSPLRPLLADRGVVKVIHGCGEDLPALRRLAGSVPGPVFDTQIAATFLGYGMAVSYADLTERLIGVSLPKHAQRTNWLKRPLSPQQVSYAALDVAHLLPVYRILCRGLGRLGRESWAEEECRALEEAERREPDPAEYYNRMGGASRLRRRQLAVLRELAALREKVASDRDLPRNWLLEDRVLLDLARASPCTQKALACAALLTRKQFKAMGADIVACVKRGMALPEEKLPAAAARSPTGARTRQLVESFREVIRCRALELGLPPEFIASKRAVRSIVQAAHDGGSRSLQDRLVGWRRLALGDDSIEALSSLVTPVQ
jgi:ribonuclease D